VRPGELIRAVLSGRETGVPDAQRDRCVVAIRPWRDSLDFHGPELT
jgi:hypothetical protein